MEKPSLPKFKLQTDVVESLKREMISKIRQQYFLVEYFEKEESRLAMITKLIDSHLKQTFPMKPTHSCSIDPYELVRSEFKIVVNEEWTDLNKKTLQKSTSAK